MNVKKCLIHEINHIFFAKIFGLRLKPRWISEGLALNLDGYGFGHGLRKEDLQLIMKKKKIVLPYSTPRKERWLFYPLGYFGVKYILKHYGKKKLFLFLKEYAKNPTKKRYKLLFAKHFKDLNSFSDDVKRFILEFSKGTVRF